MTHKQLRKNARVHCCRYKNPSHAQMPGHSMKKVPHACFRLSHVVQGELHRRHVKYITLQAPPYNRIVRPTHTQGCVQPEQMPAVKGFHRYWFKAKIAPRSLELPLGLLRRSKNAPKDYSRRKDKYTSRIQFHQLPVAILDNPKRLYYIHRDSFKIGRLQAGQEWNGRQSTIHFAFLANARLWTLPQLFWRSHHVTRDEDNRTLPWRP